MNLNVSRSIVKNHTHIISCHVSEFFVMKLFQLRNFSIVREVTVLIIIYLQVSQS